MSDKETYEEREERLAAPRQVITATPEVWGGTRGGDHPSAQEWREG